MMLAGGERRSGYTHGSSDELRFKVATSTSMTSIPPYLLGLDHERLTFKFKDVNIVSLVMSVRSNDVCMTSRFCFNNNTNVDIRTGCFNSSLSLCRGHGG